MHYLCRTKALNMESIKSCDKTFNINNDTSTVTFANNAHPGCFSETTIYRNTSPVQNMDDSGIFIVPEIAKDKYGAEYIVTSIAEGDFDCVNEAVEIHIPKTISKIGWGFWQCKRLLKFVVSPNNKHYCDIDGVLYSKNKKKLIAYPNAKGTVYKIPNGVECIENCAFKSTEIEKITIPGSLQRIGTNAFYGCNKLQWIIDIPASIVEVADYQNPTGIHSANPKCRMSNGEITTFKELIRRHPTKKTK